MINKQYSAKFFTIIVSILIMFHHSFSQALLQPWGNMAGIKIKGQLIPFETSIKVIGKNGSFTKATGKEKQRPKFMRKGMQQIVTTSIDSLYFVEKVEDIGNGKIKIMIEATAASDEDIDGIFFCLTLPDNYKTKGTMQADKKGALSLNGDIKTLNNYINTAQNFLNFTAQTNKIRVNFSVTPQRYPSISNESFETGKHLTINFPIHKGMALKGLIVKDSFIINADGAIDKSPVAIKINYLKTGNTFDGFGGNFRLQNPKADPLVIDYCLKNMRVAWGRVEMPWRFWQPVKDSDPIAAAKNGNLDPAVKNAMEMAQRLGKMNMPFILSAWSGPAWSVVGIPKFNPGADGVWGNPLNKDSMQQIYKSIADYIVYLKDNYGVEPAMFSFNESDLGINIRQTAEEHLQLIKGLGTYFIERGIKTKLLLGDNSDATSYKFVYAALNDTLAYPFIGAVSFHSWRGCNKETLLKWAGIAAKIKKPLIVAEGSIDAQAWGYPAVFEEPSYAIQEIELYIRLLAICEPLSILQWQLTSDYSPLVGGGIFGNNEALRATQRFYNLKQLAETPKGLMAMPVVVNRDNIVCAALGDNEKGIYVLHIVNSGADRNVTLSGLPKNLTALKNVITNNTNSILQGKPIRVVNGNANFKVASDSYLSLSSQ